MKNDYNYRDGILFVGGFGHKPNQDAVLWFVEHVFPQILSKYPEIKFYIVGSNPTDDIKTLQSRNIEVVGYVTDEELEKYYSKVRIAVVPLRFGAGIKGKVLEAMHNQLPLITTPIGAEGLDGIEEYVQVVEDANGFINSFTKLYDDKAFWELTSARSREFISSNFSIESAKEQLLKDMNHKMILYN
ncbi:Glycosyl transferases group 1 [compost metagenome]